MIGVKSYNTRFLQTTYVNRLARVQQRKLKRILFYRPNLVFDNALVVSAKSAS